MKVSTLISLAGFILLASLALLIFFTVPAYMPPNSLPESVPAGLTVSVPWTPNYMRLAMLSLVLAMTVFWLLSRPTSTKNNR